MTDLLLGLGFVVFIIVVWRCFLKSMYKAAMTELKNAEKQFIQATGHKPPKTAMDNWFQWKKKECKK